MRTKFNKFMAVLKVKSAHHRLNPARRSSPMPPMIALTSLKRILQCLALLDMKGLTHYYLIEGDVGIDIICKPQELTLICSTKVGR